MRCSCIFLGILLAACNPGTPVAKDTLDSFFRAVQERDLDELRCLMAGAADAEELGSTPAERRSNFEAWAGERYAAYESGRDAGWVDLDEQGLTLVKLFALGRGAYAAYGAVRRSGPDALVVESDIRFGYAHIDLSPFSPGTTLYVCGAPVGRVHALRVPASSQEVTVELLDRVRVEWTLVRAESRADCDAGWTVASAVPVAGSADVKQVTWVF